LLTLNKNNELAVQTTGGKMDGGFGYILFFGPSHHDFIGKLALNRVENGQTSNLF
jgi:hypothetical protein